MINHITFCIAILLSIVAAFFSVAGLSAIFSAAMIPIIIMGSILEAAKVVSVSWLYRNWGTCPATIKYYLIVAISILMLITSMGTFGYLSKAHSDQNLVSGDVLSKISIYDEKIKNIKDNIEVDRKILKQNDDAVDQVMSRSSDEKGAERAISIRKAQQGERSRIQREIETYQKELTKLNEERAPIAAQVRQVEAEVGPIKYIASLIYGNSVDSNALEKAVIWVIILIVIVFDPLAVVLLLSANHGFKHAENNKLEIQQWVDNALKLKEKKKKGIIEIDEDQIATFK